MLNRIFNVVLDSFFLPWNRLCLHVASRPIDRIENQDGRINFVEEINVKIVYHVGSPNYKVTLSSKRNTYKEDCSIDAKIACSFYIRNTNGIINYTNSFFDFITKKLFRSICSNSPATRRVIREF